MKIKPIHTLIVITLLLGVVYISETNNLWLISYILSDEKKALADAKQRYTELNIQIAQYNSIGNITANPEIATMEKSNFIHLDKNGALVKK
jgi:hypothetical protein